MNEEKPEHRDPCKKSFVTGYYAATRGIGGLATGSTTLYCTHRNPSILRLRYFVTLNDDELPAV